VVQLETELSDLQALMGLSKDRTADLRERTSLGKSRGSEVATAESQYATYRAEEAGLRGDIAVAREELSFIIGAPVDTSPVVDDLALPADVPPVDELVVRSRDRSDVAALREEVIARRAGIRVARASYSPSLTATGNYYLERPSGSQEEIDWDAIFFLDMPIFQGGAARAFNLEARSLFRQAERSLARLTRLTESDVRTAHAELTSSIEQARLYEDAYQRSRRSYDLLLKDYRLGLANNLDVLQTMNALQTVKRDFDLARLQSKLDLLNLRLSVEMAPENLP
jgi:outer membrane protein TolC